MPSQKKKKTLTELPNLMSKSAQYTKKSKTRIPKRARNYQFKFDLNDLQDNSD